MRTRAVLVSFSFLNQIIFKNRAAKILAVSKSPRSDELIEFVYEEKGDPNDVSMVQNDA